jgi:hypothetical protein
MAYEDWFQNMFDIDTSGNTDVGTGGDAGSYSGADYDAMFAQQFGTATGGEGGGDGGGGMLAAAAPETQAGAPAGAASASYSGGTDVLGSVGAFATEAAGTLKEWFDKATKLFTEPETTKRVLNKETGQYEDVATGGGMNSLGKLLIAGAIQSLGQGSVMKWQAERASKEKAKDRAAVVAAKNEEYRRKAYGAAPQIGTPQRGIGLIGTGSK